MENKHYDIIIIGAGIAGLTAAIFAGRANKKTLVLERSGSGGQILKAHSIDNYPGVPSTDGYTLSSIVEQQARDAGAEIISANVIAADLKSDIKTVNTDMGTFSATCLIIAVGSAPKTLGLSNEKELTGSGISYCASCDGAFFRNKTVAVVGSGETAKSDTEYLSPLAEKVYLITKKDGVLTDVPANVEIIKGAITALVGNPLSAIDVTVSDGEKRQLDTKGLFIAVGNMPSTEMFGDALNLDEKGYIITDDSMQTGIEGVYAAGDVRKKSLRQLINAAGDGAVAAASAIKRCNLIKAAAKNK